MTTELTMPEGYERWNRAHLGAFKKGAAHFLAGGSLDMCPYEDHRKPSGRLSWSRSFIGAWQDGWRWAQQELQPGTSDTARTSSPAQ